MDYKFNIILEGPLVKTKPKPPNGKVEKQEPEVPASDQTINVKATRVDDPSAMTKSKKGDMAKKEKKKTNPKTNSKPNPKPNPKPDKKPTPEPDSKPDSNGDDKKKKKGKGVDVGKAVKGAYNFAKNRVGELQQGFGQSSFKEWRERTR